MELKRSFVTGLALLIVCACALQVFAVGNAPRPSVSEQTVAADPAVTILLCLESGSIIVRGWERKEVRARNSSGGQIELRRADAANESAPATRIEVLMPDAPDVRPRPGQCGRSSDVELDVPRGSSVQLRGHSGDIDVTGVASVRADTLSGSIELRNISHYAEVTTANGDVTLKHARGRARLRTISGLVEINDAQPAEPSDDLWAKTTSGDISLTQIGHAHVEATAAAGSVSLTGPLAPGGFYDLKTTNGDVTLTLPTDSSFFVNAKVFYGGDIVTDFPVRLAPGPSSSEKVVPDKKHPEGPKGNVALTGGNLTGVYGPKEKGDATLNLASFSGSVRLRKKVTSDK